MLTDDIFEGLSPPQQEAVKHSDGPLLIVAGPGSGKTRVMAHRVAYLVRHLHAKPWRILAVTFTNKAARELRERCESLVPELVDSFTAQVLPVRTFHSFCALVLRRKPEHAGLEPGFSIYDDDDQHRTMRRTLEDLKIDPKRFPPRSILNTISSAKNSMIGVEQFASTVETYGEEVVARLYEGYERALHAANAVDFDDLLLKVFQLLSSQQDVLEEYQNRYEYLLLDEFQDTNPLQFHIARLIAERHRNICVVGDPDQSIYSWRHADPANISEFQRLYPDATIVTLDQCYRSTQLILEAADSVIANNSERLEKHLWTENIRGEPVAIAEAYDENEEARLILDEIGKLDEEDIKRGEIAVMYRINAQSRAMETACNQRGVPYRLVGGLKFYQRKEVKDLICFLRLVNNPADDAALERIINVPARGIGQRTVDELRRVARENGVPLLDVTMSLQGNGNEALTNGAAPYRVQLKTRAINAVSEFAGLMRLLIQQSMTLQPRQLMGLVLERSGYLDSVKEDMERGEEKMENLQELLGSAEQFAIDNGAGPEYEPRELLSEFLENVALVSDVDTMDRDGDLGDAITLITLHQAKGLEFDAVFMIGLEEGLLPHSRSMEDPSQVEEERRLCYVGMTRARKRLYMLGAFQRNARRNLAGEPSRFLQEIPESAVTRQRIRGMRRGQRIDEPAAIKRAAAVPAAHSAARPRAQYSPGDQVKHAHFGKGVVISSRDFRGDAEVTVAFDGQGIKRLMLNFAPLSKLVTAEEGEPPPRVEKIDPVLDIP